MSDDKDFSSDDTVEEELVAYLDGELDDAANARIERRLADDSQYRLRLQKLQRAWDMLELLPQSKASEAFTQSTVEMVTVKVTHDIEQARGSWFGKEQLLWIATVAGILVGLMIGFVVTRTVVTADNRRLVRDLPVIENFDLYYHVDTIEFLRQLDAEQIFVNEDVIDEGDDAT